MPPLDPKGFLLVLLWFCSCGATKSNDTVLRTFYFFKGRPTDEPFDPSDIYGEENPSREPPPGSGAFISEEALQFLTGPVSTVLMPSFYALVCGLSVPVNFFAVLAFGWGIRPKKPAAIFMLNLAVADLLFGLVVPFKIFYHFRGNDWPFGPLMCQGVTAAFYWNMYCSVLLIACISVDRLLAVAYPIRSLSWRRPQNAVAACAGAWVLSLAFSVPLVVSDQTVYVSQLNVTTCHDVQDSENAAWLRDYFLAVSCALFFLPMLVTVASYTKVIWRLSSGLTGSSHKRKRALVMALTVLLIFLLCFMPTNCLLLAHYLLHTSRAAPSRDTPDGSYGLYLVFLCLGSLNCLLDPLAYYFGSSQCQRQMTAMLRCHEGAPKRESMTRSTSDSCRSSTRAILKVGGTEGCQAAEQPSSQYSKLLL